MTRPYYRYIALGWILVGTAHLLAQRPTELRITEKVELNELAPDIVLPVKCDSAESLYFRVHQGEQVGRGPILRVSADGKKVLHFSLEGIPDLAEGRIIDFAPGLNGDVVLLFEKGKEEQFLVEFDSDGKFRTKFKLEAPVRAHQVGVLSTGDLLIAGRQVPTPDESLATLNWNNTKPFLGLFTFRGQLRKRVALSNDLTPKIELAKTLIGENYQKTDKSYDTAVLFSQVLTTDEGYGYVARHTSQGPVYAISAAGVVARKMPLQAPPEGHISGFSIAGRLLFAKYLILKPDSNQIKDVVIDVIDTASGKKIGEYYHSDYHIGSALACGSRDGSSFTFLGNNERMQLTLIRTAAK